MMNENYNTPNSGCCGRPFPTAPENKCNYNDCCMNEYAYKQKACIRNKQPDCESQAVIPSITVETVDGISNLANCLVHVMENNTTYYVDDKHRILITWAGPVNIPGYDMEGNPNNYKNQIVTDVEAETAVIYDNHGKGYIFGITPENLQQAVNDKLDEMATDGTLGDIISQYIENVVFGFDTVADMKADTNFTNDSFAQTLGFYGKNDGGGGTYKIRELATGEVADGHALISLDHDNLVAELINNANIISVKQFGAYGDDTHDDTDAFNAAIAYVGTHHGKLYIDKGVYKLTSKLTIDWNSGNFNQAFNQSFELFGAGQLETKLHFTSSDGLDLNPNNNALVIKIHDFCIENSDYNNLEDTGNTRTPDLTHGVGLKVKHIGCMGRVSNIAVRGFYVGIMSTNCYGGPIFENLFVKNAVFGYYSASDTTIEHNSCSYVGCECCYLQDGCRSTLTNVICESNQHFFVTNEYNQRSKFEGYGFQFTGSANVVCNGCYAEDLYGNAIKIVNSAIVDNLSTFNNFMHRHLSQSGYEDLAQWLEDNPGHNYDDVYVSLNSQNRNLVLFNGTQIDVLGTAYVDVYQGSTLLSETSAVEFRGMTQTGTYSNNVERYNKGHTKPILSFNRSNSLNGSTIGFTPDKTYGIPEFYNMLQPTSNTGNNSLVVTRKATYTDTSYDEVKFIVKQALDGSIRIFRSTFLNGTQVAQVEVIRIGSDNRVTFPQN